MKPSDKQFGGDHYKSMAIQPHYFCHMNKLGALESNVVKYVCRHSKKNGKADLLKAKHYIELLLEWQYGDDGQTSIPTASGVAASTHAMHLKGVEVAADAYVRATCAGKPVEPQTWQCYEDTSLRGTELRCVCGWTGRKSDLQRATVRTHPFCPDCGADFLPAELPGGWPYLAPEQATCIPHGLTTCKVCVFPSGTKD